MDNNIVGESPRDNALRKAYVDEFKRLGVFATTQEQESHASGQGVSFSLTTSDVGDVLSIPISFDGYIAIIQNNLPNRNATFQEIDMEADGELLIEFIRNPTFTLSGLGNAQEMFFKNNNFSSTTPALSTARVWDEVGTGISGLTTPLESKLLTKIADIGTAPFTPRGSIKLGAGNTLGVRVKNQSGAIRRLIVNFDFFFEFA